MKFIITTIYKDSKGGCFFNPRMDLEVFDNYLSALRYLVLERRTCEENGWHSDIEKIEDISGFGRLHLWTLSVKADYGFYHIYLSRINENGFH